MIDSKTQNDLIKFKNDTNQLKFPVKVKVEAVAYILPEDVILRSSSQQLIASGGTAAARDTLRLTIKAYDFERYECHDPTVSLQLFAGSCETGFGRQEIVVKIDSGNTFRGEIPGNWLEDAGEYSLCTNRSKMGFAGESVASLKTFLVAESSALQFAFAAVALTVIVAMLALMLVMIFRNKQRAKQIALSFLKHEMIIAAEVLADVWDVIG